jgi:G:T-mismatch repair DNA endonuclease (very short patch repair protein)
MFSGAWRRLRLFALEAHDLALSKLERNMERDRDDVQQLARAGHLRADILRERYYAELRPNLLAHEARHDLTLRLWLESYWPA